MLSTLIISHKMTPRYDRLFIIALGNAVVHNGILAYCSQYAGTVQYTLITAY